MVWCCEVERVVSSSEGDAADGAHAYADVPSVALLSLLSSADSVLRPPNSHSQRLTTSTKLIVTIIIRMMGMTAMTEMVATAGVATYFCLQQSDPPIPQL